jgi:hypothetical protein
MGFDLYEMREKGTSRKAYPAKVNIYLSEQPMEGLMPSAIRENPMRRARRNNKQQLVRLQAIGPKLKSDVGYGAQSCVFIPGEQEFISGRDVETVDQVLRGGEPPTGRGGQHFISWDAYYTLRRLRDTPVGPGVERQLQAYSKRAFSLKSLEKLQKGLRKLRSPIASTPFLFTVKGPSGQMYEVAASQRARLVLGQRYKHCLGAATGGADSFSVAIALPDGCVDFVQTASVEPPHVASAPGPEEYEEHERLGPQNRPCRALTRAEERDLQVLHEKFAPVSQSREAWLDSDPYAADFQTVDSLITSMLRYLRSKVTLTPAGQAGRAADGLHTRETAQDQQRAVAALAQRYPFLARRVLQAAQKVAQLSAAYDKLEKETGRNWLDPDFADVADRLEEAEFAFAEADHQFASFGSGITRTSAVLDWAEAERAAGGDIVYDDYEQYAPRAGMGRRNPKGMPREFFDPREMQLAAQVQAIFYGSLGRKDPRKMSQKAVDEAVGRAFGVATRSERHVPKPKRVRGTKLSVGQSPWITATGRIPTERTIRASKERYEGTYVGSDRKRRTLTDLVETRQGYELMLAMRRKKRATTGFYRVTMEPVSGAGMRYFVWPLPPGAAVPGPGVASRAEADAICADLNRRANPYKTGDWWMPVRKRYTKAQLRGWLPAASVFSRNYTPKPSRRPARRRRTA